MTKVQNLSLAERHRPQVLADIFGQDEIVAYLREQIRTKSGRSILLHGPSGCGKSCIAEIYAGGLLCEDGVDGLCDSETCESCSAIRGGEHPNFLVMRHGSMDDTRFALDINSAIEIESFGSGGFVVLIDQAQLLSERAFEILHERMARPMQDVTYILCAEDQRRIPNGTSELFYPLEVRSPNITTGRKFLARLCELEQIKVENGALGLMVEFESASFRGLARDLEILGRQGAITERGVAQFHCGDRATSYVDLVFRRESFDRQLELLEDWNEGPARKVRQVGRYLSDVFESAAGRTTASSRSLQIIQLERRAALVEAFANHVSELEVQPRVFARKLIEIWSVDAYATRLTLLRKASEFDELLGETQLKLFGADVKAALKPWRKARARTDELRLREAKYVEPRPTAVSDDTENYLKDSEVRKLWDSASFLIQAYGVVLNAWISIYHNKLNLKNAKGAGELVTDFGRELRMFVDEPIGSSLEPDHLHWLYVNRHDDQDGLVTEIVAHIPPSAKDVAVWALDFFRRRIVRPYSADAFNFRLYRCAKNKRYARHLTLIRGMCAAAYPNPANRVFMHQAKISLRMNRPLGPKMTAQRIGVSRLLDVAVQREAPGATGGDGPACRAARRRREPALRNRAADDLAKVADMGGRRAKAALSSGCKPHPATAPAGSNRSSHGGNEVAEAFD